MKKRSFLCVLAVLALTYGCSGPTVDSAPDGEDQVALERIVFSSLRPSNWDIFHFESPGAEPTPAYRSSWSRLRCRVFSRRPLGDLHIRKTRQSRSLCDRSR